jgi:hypothetical protein
MSQAQGAASRSPHNIAIATSVREPVNTSLSAASGTASLRSVVNMKEHIRSIRRATNLRRVEQERRDTDRRELRDEADRETAETHEDILRVMILDDETAAMGAIVAAFVPVAPELRAIAQVLEDKEEAPRQRVANAQEDAWWTLCEERDADEKRLGARSVAFAAPVVAVAEPAPAAPAAAPANKGAAPANEWSDGDDDEMDDMDKPVRRDGGLDADAEEEPAAAPKRGLGCPNMCSVM